MSIERELKLTLTEAEAALLAAAFGPPLHTFRQRNHYLDTPEGALRRRGYGLRLREEDGDLRLTLKGPTRGTGGMTERLELEAAISRDEARDLLAGGRCLAELPLPIPDELRDPSTSGHLRELGMIENQRRVIRLPLPGVPPRQPIEVDAELDRTRYPDGSIENELEIEWPHPETPFPEAAVRELLSRHGIPWRPGTKSKLARFLERTGR